MINKKDTKEYFQRLKNEIPWAEITWASQTVPRLVFNYNELERVSRKCSILDELTLLLQETFETTVCGIECNYYRDGNDYHEYHKKRKRHIFILSLGASREMIMKRKQSESFVNLKNGGIFYSSLKNNLKYRFSVPASPSNKPRIEICFFTDEPYIKRKQHLRYINVLGVGKIPLWFHGDQCNFPEDTVAAILPASFAQMVGGSINPLIDNFESPVEILFEQI